MKLVHLKALDTGRRVQGFLDRNAVAIEDHVSPRCRQNLDEVVEQIAAFQLEQSVAADIARGETAQQVASRHALYRVYLAPMKRIARRKLTGTAQYPIFVVPATIIRHGDFLRAAINAAEAAALYEQVFVDSGMPADFLERFREGIAALTASSQSRRDQLTLRSETTAGLDVMESALRDIVGVIDGLLTPVLAADYSLLAGWKTAKRFHRTGVSSPTGDDPATKGGVAPLVVSTPALVQPLEPAA